MADKDTTTTSSSPEKAKAEPKETSDTSSEDRKTVTLAVGGLPFNFRDFRVPQEDGSMLVFDETGTEVDAEDAEALQELAATNGVALYRKDA